MVQSHIAVFPRNYCIFFQATYQGKASPVWRRVLARVLIPPGINPVALACILALQFLQ